MGLWVYKLVSGENIPNINVDLERSPLIVFGGPVDVKSVSAIQPWVKVIVQNEHEDGSTL